MTALFRDSPVTITMSASLTIARFSATWKRSRVKGTLLVDGTAPRPVSYVIDVTNGSATKIHVSLQLPAGAFSRKLKLPANVLPGSYHVALLPADSQVKGATLDAKLAAPATGIVDVAFVAGGHNGPPTLTHCATPRSFGQPSISPSCPKARSC